MPSHEDLAELKKYCQQVVVLKSSVWQKLVGLVYAWLQGWPLQAGLRYSKKYERQIQKEIGIQGIDVVYCQLIRMAPYCQHILHHKVLDYMDALGLGMFKRAALVSPPLKWLYLWEARRVKDYEKKLSLHFDALTVITAADGAALDLPKSHAPLQVVANGIDSDYFALPTSKEALFDVGFVGNLGYLPNIGAVKYLVNVVAPGYKQKFGRELKILFSGARPDAEVLTLANENRVVKSWVDDIRTSYWNINILVAPIFYGTGQQNKIMEAMACGVPVICSPEVAIGVGARHQEELLIAEDADQFVQAIHQLLSNQALRAELCKNAREFVVQHFSWEKNTNALTNVLDTNDLSFAK